MSADVGGCRRMPSSRDPAMGPIYEAIGGQCRRAGAMSAHVGGQTSAGLPTRVLEALEGGLGRTSFPQPKTLNFKPETLQALNLSTRNP